ncbi:MAG: DUF2949 domain-containing protein [Gloeobacterales cyanobacterium]
MVLHKAKVMEILVGELALAEAEIALALKSCHTNSDLLPIILWKYGFISLQQLDRLLQLQTE